MTDLDDLIDLIARFRVGDVSAEITVMRLLATSEDVGAARAAAAAVPELLRLLDENADGCARIVAMLKSGMDSPEPPASVDDGIAAARRLFDWSVGQNEESSVALYSLGNPDILAAATREVVDELDRHGPLDASQTVVELGCGIGRFLEAVAPRVRTIHGLDVAPAMVAVARRRCAAWPNVSVAVASGHDLGGVADASVDLVLAVDVFPYIVHAGMPLVDEIFADIARVLVPGGVLALFHFSYRGDLERDRSDVAALAARHGLEIRMAGERRFKLWDGPAFRLTRAPTGSARSSAPRPPGA
jgi:predicted TPR repeat methyltransferase